VGIVALAGFFESYDLSMMTAAFKQIRETFGLTQAEMTSLVAWVRLGAIPAFFVLPLADRFGRRRMFLAALVGMSLATFLSAFAQTAVQYVVCQTVTRTFVVASISTAVVIVAEELPAEHRGWGIGILGAISSFGFGLGAVLYAFVDTLPFGWRSLYVVGIVPLALMPLLRRRVPETGRFERHRRETIERKIERAGGARADPATNAPEPLAVAGGWGQPMLEMLRDYPFRSLAVATMALVAATGFSPAFGLLSDFVQTTHGWKPSSYSLMAVLAGALGVIGNPAMGWAADRFGRRPVALAAFGVFPLIVYAVYFGPGSGIPLFWIPLVFILTGGNVLMRIITTELFPTSSRNTAMGWETLQETLGSAAGYALVGGFTAVGASIAPAVVGVAALTVLAAIVVWWLPETAGRELERTSEVVG
jgi:putative MFS transporter